MNPQQRPTAVLVMAILNFVWGGWKLMGFLCGGLGLLFILVLVKNLPAPPAGPGGTVSPNPMADMWGMYESVPGFFPYTLVTTVVGLGMETLLIVAGVGLLKLRPWARSACLVYSVYTIFITLVGTVYTIVWVKPAILRWFEEHSPVPGAAPPTMFMSGGLSDLLSILGAVIGMAYAVALLVVMLLPHVRAAFVRSPGEPRYLDAEPAEPDGNEEEEPHLRRRPPRGDEFEAGPER
jgi:hypothetical protein